MKWKHSLLSFPILYLNLVSVFHSFPFSYYYSIATIGPLGFLCLLGITFSIGAQLAKRTPVDNSSSSSYRSSRPPTLRSSRTTKIEVRSAEYQTSLGGGRAEHAEVPSGTKTSNFILDQDGMPGTSAGYLLASPGLVEKCPRSSQRSLRGVWKVSRGNESGTDQVGRRAVAP